MAFTTGLPMRPGEVRSYPTSNVTKKKKKLPVSQQRPRTFRDHCHENGTPKQAQESARRARKLLGERED